MKAHILFMTDDRNEEMIVGVYATKRQATAEIKWHLKEFECPEEMFRIETHNVQQPEKRVER